MKFRLALSCGSWQLATASENESNFVSETKRFDSERSRPRVKFRYGYRYRACCGLPILCVETITLWNTIKRMCVDTQATYRATRVSSAVARSKVGRV